MSSYRLSFESGVVQDRDTVRVLARTEHGSSAATKLITFHREQSAWTGLGYEFDWRAHRIALHRRGHEAELFLLGRQGRIACALRDEDSIEEIDPLEGARRSGEFTDLQLIGSHLYACGMSRQVYRREGKNVWLRVDAGVVQPSGAQEPAGFTSIHGLHEDDFYAVGLHGEIWRCQNASWRRLGSPTSASLHCVRMIATDEIYACGQQGILLRGDGAQFQPIDGRVGEDLWSLQTFAGALWFASEHALYRLPPGAPHLERVETGLGERARYRQLHAEDGVMWSFGASTLAWTTDGTTWHDATPQTTDD